jgi:glycosyltransferase involved in cell wall biosynthesis
LVEPENPASLATALEFVLSHPQQADGVQKKSQESVKSGFTWDRVVADYDRLYRELLGL